MNFTNRKSAFLLKHDDLPTSRSRIASGERRSRKYMKRTGGKFVCVCATICAV